MISFLTKAKKQSKTKMVKMDKRELKNIIGGYDEILDNRSIKSGENALKDLGRTP